MVQHPSARARRPFVATLALAALSLVAAACTSKGATARTVDVSLADFTITPSGEARSGSPLTLNVHNDGTVPHSMAVEVAGKRYETAQLGSNTTAKLALPALAAGTYTLFCTVPGHREAGMESTLTVTAAAPKAAATEAPSAADIDRMHEEGIKAFPAKTQGLGGQVLAPKLIDGFKVFEITTKAIRWEVSPGQFVDAYGYNGQVPGPEIRVQRGDKVRVVLHNQLPESTTIHFHGVTVPNAMDGVPFITQPPVTTGRSFTYEFMVKDPPGTYMYHSHHNATIQVGKGLLGAFIVEPDTRSWDVEQTMVLGDGPLGYTLNGKGFPATSPIVAKLGQTVLVRFMNEGQIIHPMHLHGFRFQVVAKDGIQLQNSYLADTVMVAPGERYDAVFTADAKGIWAFHCHILSHAESEHGMHGMVTAVIVQ